MWVLYIKNYQKMRRKRFWPTLFRWPIPWVDEEVEDFFLTPFGSYQDYKMNVEETDEGYNVTVDVPGFNSSEIDVNFHDGVLTVSGKKSEERRVEEEKKNYLLLERSSQEFTRQWTAPAKIDEAGIKARMKNGLLTVFLPKSKEEKPKISQIKIEEEK